MQNTESTAVIAAQLLAIVDRLNHLEGNQAAQLNRIEIGQEKHFEQDRIWQQGHDTYHRGIDLDAAERLTALESKLGSRTAIGGAGFLTALAWQVVQWLGFKPPHA